MTGVSKDTMKYSHDGLQLLIMDQRSSMKTYRRWRCSEPGCNARALGKDLAGTSRHVLQHMTSRFHCADGCGRLYCQTHRNPSQHECNPATEGDPHPIR